MSGLLSAILRPAILWTVAISAVAGIQTSLGLPQLTYLLVIVFALFWGIEAITCCLVWSPSEGTRDALGLLTAFVLFRYWPNIEGGLTVQATGPQYQFLTESDLTTWLIAGVVISDWLLPWVLIVSTGILALGNVIRLLRPKPSNKPTTDAAGAGPVSAAPRQSGYVASEENPLDTFRRF
ncbi:hypothetical protein [uncultured Ruegeria sp.]|uniref:hypothetical protein n=1 Tax=uncultured Ruegeria sp. TaxID=259304 RepID=UPI00262A8053|nr:hypothetical protein [uncultured Ruegeria sp.]